MPHKVAIVMGSGSDRPVMEKAGAMLEQFGIEQVTRVLSAHKTPDQAIEFAATAATLATYGLDPTVGRDLESIVGSVRPTILIGTSGTPGSFAEPAIRTMAAHVSVPIIMPLSNPTTSSEARPHDLLAWTDGRALIASGSPFEPVDVDGRTRVIGQANNVFVFPGVGLGAILSEAREITDDLFLVAADTLASLVTPERFALGSLYPPVSDLRRVSREIAVAIVRAARDTGIGRNVPDELIGLAVDAGMWWPEYQEYEAI